MRKPEVVAFPKPQDITYDRVKALLEQLATHNTNYYSIIKLLDVMNGLDPKWCERPYYDKEYAEWDKACKKARKKLQQAPGMTHHETPTSGQASAVRKHLNKLIEEKLVEKRAGGGLSNNSYSYRLVTAELLADRNEKDIAKHKATGQANALARMLSLALGGKGWNGAKPLVTADGGKYTVGVQLTISADKALRLLSVLAHHKLGDIDIDVADRAKIEAHFRKELAAWEDSKYTVRAWTGTSWVDCVDYVGVNYEVAKAYYDSLMVDGADHHNGNFGIYPAETEMSNHE